MGQWTESPRWVGALAVVWLVSSAGCSSGAPAVAVSDGSADGPAVTDDGSTTGSTDANYVIDAPEGAPGILVLDQAMPFDLGSHCGRTAVFFDSARTSTYVLDVTAGGQVHASSNALNMVNASVYCTFTLPSGTKSVMLHRGLANVQIDPANAAASVSGGGLGFLIYLGASSPRDGAAWGDYGRSALATWKETRPDWNHDLPAEDTAVAVPASATTATFAVYIVDAWSNLTVDGDVASVTVEASSSTVNGDAAVSQ